tara:strand:- start:962 stop:1414 length:453 start_codon:yes stop_codon:yes gene_type:complete
MQTYNKSKQKEKNIFKMRHNTSIKTETFLFVIIGIMAVLIDTSSYLFLFYLTASINLSKFISFIMGAVFSYYGNKNITFNVKAKKLTPVYFSLVYSISLGLNIFTNSFSLYLLQNKETISILIAFFIATIISALFNFIMMKFFVFNKRIN